MSFKGKGFERIAWAAVPLSLCLVVLFGLAGLVKVRADASPSAISELLSALEKGAAKRCGIYSDDYQDGNYIVTVTDHDGAERTFLVPPVYAVNVIDAARKNGVTVDGPAPYYTGLRKISRRFALFSQGTCAGLGN